MASHILQYPMIIIQSSFASGLNHDHDAFLNATTHRAPI